MKRSGPPLRPELLDRYLGLLGVSKRRPSVAALGELVRAHLCRVPFENVSKIYDKKHHGLRRLPGLERFLDGIDRFHFGGTCYANNYYFYRLLVGLGYPVVLCGADMANPDVHLASIVDLESRQFLVDVGYAAPFLTPLPRDLPADYLLEFGRDRYVLKPRDAEGRSRLDLYREGKWKHGYVVKPVPREIGHFERVITDSYRGAATFMNAILLARFFPDRSLMIHNRTVIESRKEGLHVRTLADRRELARAITDCFAIPAEIARDVVFDLGRLEDAWD